MPSRAIIDDELLLEYHRAKSCADDGDGIHVTNAIRVELADLLEHSGITLNQIMWESEDGEWSLRVGVLDETHTRAGHR
jgi:hypothetical protein